MTAPWWRAALVGVGLLVVLTAIKQAVPAIGHPTPFLTYFAAILAAAWFGGMRAGLLLTAASAAAGYYWFIAEGEELRWSRVALQVSVFAAEGLAISWLAARAQRERQRSIAAMHATHDAVSLLEGVLDALDLGVTVQDAEGRVVYANAAAARVVGATRSQMRATPVGHLADRFELLDVDGKLLPLEHLPGRLLLSGRDPLPAERLVQLRERGGTEVRFSLVCAQALPADGGRLRYVVNTFRDVTEARRQEEEIRTSREWFSTALRSIGDAVIATDPGGRVTFMNPVAEALTGWRAAEAMGQPLGEVFEIIHEETRTAVESPVDKVIREGAVVGLANHTILVSKQGGELAIDDSAAPIRGSDGALVGVVLVFRDVTTPRREQTRRELLARATELLGSSLDYEATLGTLARLAVPRIADWAAVDMREDDGTVRRLAVAHVDASKLRLVEEIERRYPVDPHAKSGVPEILRCGKAEWIAEIPSAAIEAMAAQYDEEYLRLVRELQLHSYIGVPLAIGGKVLGVLTLVMAESRRTYDAADLQLATALADRAAVAVENARLYRAAELARADAVQASRAKDDFLAMLGHELRNPLAPILTSLELMKLQPHDVDRARQVIERQVRAMVRLVDDLLDISRIVHGRIELTRERVELAELVAKGLETSMPLIEQRRHRVEVEVARGLEVDADPQRMVQVIGNLLTNAAKYTEPGGHITVRGAADGDEVVLRVRDDGVGISPEMLARIFDVFVQQPQALDRAQGGLGLGLAIVRSLVDLHGGRVEAYSEGPGRGSELVVRLPAAR